MYFVHSARRRKNALSLNGGQAMVRSDERCGKCGGEKDGQGWCRHYCMDSDSDLPDHVDSDADEHDPRDPDHEHGGEG